MWLPFLSSSVPAQPPYFDPGNCQPTRIAIYLSRLRVDCTIQEIEHWRWIEVSSMAYKGNYFTVENPNEVDVEVWVRTASSTPQWQSITVAFDSQRRVTFSAIIIAPQEESGCVIAR